MSLSNERMPDTSILGIGKNYVYLEYDVKRFIRKLKEELKDNVSLLNRSEEDNILDIVNKLAGDALVAKSEGGSE